MRRSRTLARSGLAVQVIDEISNAIRAMWLSAREWAEQHASGGIATLKYSLTETCL